MAIMNKILLKASIICIFLLGIDVASAQNNPFNVADYVYSYYQKCLDSIRKPVALEMIDTLFNMAGEEKDVRMQNVALCTRMDYFYYLNMEDSLKANVERVKIFAQKGKFVRYYYHSWGRLITFYINQRMLKKALTELELMQKEALEENEGSALEKTYQMMGRLYNAWVKPQETIEWFTKAIECIYEYNLNRSVLCFYYSAIASLQISLYQYDKALSSLDSASVHILNPIDAEKVFLSYEKLYLNTKEMKKAEDYRNRLIKMLPLQKSHQEEFDRHEMDYYAALGDYKKALELCNKLIKDSYVNIETENLLLKAKARYLIFLGDSKEGIEYYEKYIRINDSLRTEHFNQEIREQSIILQVNEIKSEKQELEIKLKTKGLTIVVIVTIALLIILALLLIYLQKNKEFNERLKKAENIKSGFLHNLSHEVRTPLNSIMGFAEIITDASSEEEIRQYSAIINHNSQKLLKLFNDAILVSEINTLKAWSTININDLCKKEMDLIKEECKEGVSLIFKPYDGETDVYTDGISITTVVRNLLSNAIKNTNSGEITIETDYYKRKQFIITVTDTGIGIPIKEQKKVFEPYYRINDMVPGAGMGLAMSSVAAETLKGTLKIDSEYTTGCRMIFTFPI